MNIHYKYVYIVKRTNGSKCRIGYEKLLKVIMTTKSKTVHGMGKTDTFHGPIRNNCP
jgi:hypothetical protein